MSVLYEGHGWKVTLETASLPDGREKKGIRVYRADTVHIIACTSGRKILMLREYRPFYGAYIWMLPSGHADKENNDMVTAAQRELQEETGYRAKNINLLWTANVSESINSSNHFFLASDLVHDPLPQDDDELIEVHEMPIEEALEKIHSSPKVHLTSAYALMRYQRETID